MRLMPFKKHKQKESDALMMSEETRKFVTERLKKNRAKLGKKRKIITVEPKGKFDTVNNLNERVLRRLY